MKIAILLSRIDQTSVTTNTLDLVSSLIKEKHEVYLITGGPSEINTPRFDRIYNNFKQVSLQVKEFKFQKTIRYKR